MDRANNSATSFCDIIERGDVRYVVQSVRRRFPAFWTRVRLALRLLV